MFAQVTEYEDPVGDGLSVGNPILLRSVNDLIYLSQNNGDWGKAFKQVVDIDFGDDETLVDWDNEGTIDGIGTLGF